VLHKLRNMFHASHTPLVCLPTPHNQKQAARIVAIHRHVDTSAAAVQAMNPESCAYLWAHPLKSSVTICSPRPAATAAVVLASHCSLTGCHGAVLCCYKMLAAAAGGGGVITAVLVTWSTRTAGHLRHTAHVMCLGAALDAAVAALSLSVASHQLCLCTTPALLLV
jgi:hypothetical protein